MGLADVRDVIRKSNPEDPRIRELNLEVDRLVAEYKRNKWIEHLEQCNLSSRLGKLVKSLLDPSRRDDRAAITFGGVSITDPKRCASYFNRQFIEQTYSDKAKRRILHKIRDLGVEQKSLICLWRHS